MSENNANPMRLDGFEFVEFASPDPEQLETVFHMLGFEALARQSGHELLESRAADGKYYYLMKKG